MEQMEKFRREETRRLIEWIDKHENEWVGISSALTDEDALVADEYKQVIRELKNNGFYQIIVMLLYSNNAQLKGRLNIPF